MTASAATLIQIPRANSLIEKLEEIRSAMLGTGDDCRDILQGIAPVHERSARNLIHYLALRHHDLRKLQIDLAAQGLSSLGRMESHVLCGVDSVLRLLHRLEGNSLEPTPPHLAGPTFAEGEEILQTNTESLLGPEPKGRSVRIMVTMPTEAAHDYQLVRNLVAGGMDCMRINCAHDGPTEWESMIRHLRRARQELGRECQVLMDIAGPKLRTGPVKPGTEVMKLSPKRNECGEVICPAHVAIAGPQCIQQVHAVVDGMVPVRKKLPASVRPGDKIRFRDARGRGRVMEVSAREDDLLIADLERTAYITPETVFHLCSSRKVHKLSVRNVQPLEQALVLKPGDFLVLTHASIAGKPAVYDARGQLMIPASIGVTLQQVFEDVMPGDRIWLDDGKIGGVVRTANKQQIKVEIVHACPTGAKLRADKGINLPDTNLKISSLTEKDLEDLAFIVAHADLVGYSFVRSEKDVIRLQEELKKLGGERLGIVLKIETQAAFERLPRLLLAAMKSERFGVMIARGDLAVECGYERTAEVQEEILWVCEAAHTPVIWATQVLESLAKTGVPSRAEVTDAAMSQRAECVMLNKGPFILDALAMLDDILRRMQAHQSKKRPMLRPLRVADALLSTFCD